MQRKVIYALMNTTTPIESPINFSVDGPDFDLDLIRSNESELESFLGNMAVYISAMINRNKDWRVNDIDVLPIKDMVGNTKSIRYLRFQFTRNKPQ